MQRGIRDSDTSGRERLGCFHPAVVFERDALAFLVVIPEVTVSV